MVLSNSRMGNLLDSIRGVPPCKDLPGDLQNIVDRGWSIGPGGILSPGAATFWPKISPGLTGQEIMKRELDLNDFGVCGEDLLHDPDSYLGAMATRGFRFAGECLKQASGLAEAADVRASVIVGVGEDFLMHGTTVRFFLRRGELPNRYWDLERFELEAIAVIGLEDIPHSGHEALDEILR